MEDHRRHDAPQAHADRPPHLIAAVFIAAAALSAPVAQDCFGPSGCRALPAGSLRGASSLALSPDGRSLYVSAYGAGELLAFRRDGRGRLDPAGCADGCAPSDLLAGTAGVAVSPGGGDVYVAADLGRSLTRFTRAADGALSFGACTANQGLHGCDDPPHDALAGASAVAVGPGGEDIYVAASDSAAVSHFKRRADGSLRLADCVADAGNFGCAKPPRHVLEGADAIAVAPDGRDVYVTSLRSGSLTRFTRSTNGKLRYRECIADGGANGCRDAHASLTAAAGLAVTEDRIFVAAQSGVVSAYRRDLHRTARIRHPALAGATGIAIGGSDVYVAAQQADAITHLTTRLTFVNRVVRPKRPLDGVYALALRGGDLYSAAPAAAALSTFRLSR